MVLHTTRHCELSKLKRPEVKTLLVPSGTRSKVHHSSITDAWKRTMNDGSITNHNPRERHACAATVDRTTPRNTRPQILFFLYFDLYSSRTRQDRLRQLANKTNWLSLARSCVAERWPNWLQLYHSWTTIESANYCYTVIHTSRLVCLLHCLKSRLLRLNTLSIWSVVRSNTQSSTYWRLL